MALRQAYLCLTSGLPEGAQYALVIRGARQGWIAF